METAAQVVEARGEGSVAFNMRKTAADERLALELAQRSAVANFASNLSEAKRREFLKIEQTVLSDLERYILSTTILDETTDRTSRRYTVTVRIQLQAGLIDELIARNSAALNANEPDKSYLSFVFVARRVSSRTEFDQRRTVRSLEERIGEESERVQISSAGASLEERRSVATVNTTGGSTLQKADQLLYEVSSAMEMNAAVVDVFSTAGFAVVEAEFLEAESEGKLSVARFRQDFGVGEDLAASTLRSAAMACRELDVRFLAVGTMDVGMSERDPVSGLIRVFVSVNGKVYDVSGRFPRTVASVGPVQYSGVGPDAQVAERNALSLAGRAAADGLVSQMRTQNLF
ncbi:MAG: hypothetical protein JJT96_11325 [Opitutales bacterium]|nr:hypothetical protein [Opitutales bacterium]